MSDKNFMALIVVIVVAIVGSILVFGGGDTTEKGFVGDPFVIADGTENDEGQTQRADHVKGSDTAQVTLFEYGDFECPACAAFFPQLQQLEQQYPDDLRVVFRHNPITSIHPNAFAAHRAAVAADNQGMFWEMHDLLYQRQQSWTAGQGIDLSTATDIFEQYAQDLGLDMDQYRADVESQETFDFIDSHLDAGSQLDVVGTPTLFLNGEEITERSAAEIGLLIDEILAGDTESTDAEDNNEPDTPAEDDSAE